MPRKILIADDDAEMIKLYTRIFADTGHHLSKASSFTEAARLIGENTYDLLITDLLLQDGLGTDLIKLFEDKMKGAKSLLVTGSVEKADPELLPEIYMEKPFNVELFLQAVTRLLGPEQAAGEAPAA